MSDDSRHQHTADHERFRQTLAQRSQAIVELWTGLRLVRWSSLQVERLRNMVHDLGNSCTQHGLPALGEYARELERRLQLVTGDAPRPQEAIAGIMASVGRLTNQIDRVLAMDPAEMPTPVDRDAAPPLVYAADEDADDLALLASCVRAFGYRVKTFGDPGAMLSELARDAPVAIVMDIGFTGGNWQGIEAVSAIRATGRSRTPVVFLSARADVEARVRALRAGASAFLTKPVDLSDLFATLRLARTDSARESLRVLVIENDETGASQHAEVLNAAGMTASVLAQPMLALEAIPRFMPDVLLLDVRLVECTGEEMVRLVSDVPEHQTLPMVCLSDDPGQAGVSRGLDLGLHRFVSRQASAHELVAALRQCVLENERWIARLGHVSHLESNRGACSRERFLFRLDTAIAASRASEPSAALVYLALDQLAEAHASYGVNAVLDIQNSMEKSVSALLGDDDCWSVLGTSVIAVLLASRSNDSQREFMASLARESASSGFWHGGAPLQCTTSAVVLPLSPGSGSVSEVLAKVERAEREARKAGGNRYVLIEEAGSQPKLKPGELGAESTDSRLQADLLALHLQPIVNERRVQQHIFDVLVRRRDSAGNLLAASAFLPELDSIGLAHDLDRWVLATAVGYMTTVFHRAKGIELAVRLSAASLEDVTLLAHVRTMVSAIDKGPGNRLVFQIDEAWLGANEAPGIEVAVALRDLGCGVMLSNFGGTEHPRNTAWATWFDYAKLSPRRLADITAGKEARNAVERMIREAQVRGARIIACQIEDEETMSTLCRWGVRLFQGKLVRM